MIIVLATWGQRKIVLKVKKTSKKRNSAVFLNMSVDDFKEKVQSPIVIGYIRMKGVSLYIPEAWHSPFGVSTKQLGCYVIL